MESAQLLKRLREAIANKPEHVPDGWKTTNQWADEWGVTNTAAGVLLGRAHRVGAIDRKIFRIKTGGRGNYPTPHYKEFGKP